MAFENITDSLAVEGLVDRSEDVCAESAERYLQDMVPQSDF